MSKVESLRKDFPFFNTSDVVYLDSGATSQKPQCVIDAIAHFYATQNANVHRGIHQLSQNATSDYESARKCVAQYINAAENEIVWTKGTTESINLVSYGLTPHLSLNDSILISEVEHHANIVPWQQLAKRTGAKLAFIKVDSNGILDAKCIKEAIKQHKPKLLALSHASNVLGSINPIQDAIAYAKQHNCLTLIDGAQAFLHLAPNMKQLDCDFYVFSAHKALGPTGVGVLYGKYQRLQELDVFQSGGEMIEYVTLTHSTFRDAPGKFETGTPNIAGIIAFTAALNYIKAISNKELREYETRLFKYLIKQLQAIDGITLYGDLEHNIGTMSFNYKNEHCFDIASLLDTYNIAVRSGHHCAQPLMSALSVPGTVRVSLSFYNNTQDIDQFIFALKHAIEMVSE